MPSKKKSPVDLIYEKAVRGELIVATDMTKIAKALLKRKWPDVEWSVTRRNSGWSDSIDVLWVDGPSVNEVVALIGPLKTAGYDGSVDLDYRNHFHLYPDGSVSFAGCSGTVDSLGHVRKANVAPREGGVKVNSARAYLHYRRIVSNALWTHAITTYVDQTQLLYHINSGLEVDAADRERLKNSNRDSGGFTRLVSRIEHCTTPDTVYDHVSKMLEGEAVSGISFDLSKALQ
jgi:hypothetical protein